MTDKIPWKCLIGAMGSSETERLIQKANSLARKKTIYQCAIGKEEIIKQIDQRIQNIINRIDEIDKELEVEMSKPLFGDDKNAN